LHYKHPRYLKVSTAFVLHSYALFRVCEVFDKIKYAQINKIYSVAELFVSGKLVNTNEILVIHLFVFFILNKKARIVGSSYKYALGIAALSQIRFDYYPKTIM